ncbi:hypothetical protein ACJX0J_041331, partial [Zea mays]
TVQCAVGLCYIFIKVSFPDRKFLLANDWIVFRELKITHATRYLWIHVYSCDGSLDNSSLDCIFMFSLRHVGAHSSTKDAFFHPLTAYLAFSDVYHRCHFQEQGLDDATPLGGVEFGVLVWIMMPFRALELTQFFGDAQSGVLIYAGGGLSLLMKHIAEEVPISSPPPFIFFGVSIFHAIFIFLLLPLL